MTKVEVRYGLTAPLDDSLMEAISQAHSVYGVLGVKLSPGMDAMTVVYDASRLSAADVDRALLGAGLPVRRTALV